MEKKIRLLLLLVVLGLVGASAALRATLPVRLVVGIACLLSVILMASFTRFFSLRYWRQRSCKGSCGILSGGPEPGAWAPEFILKTIDGRFVSLQELRARKPVVLVTGSYSCPAFRSTSGGLEQLNSRYADRVAFLILYTVEAHPEGSPRPYARSGGKKAASRNRDDGIFVTQPQKYEERMKLAAQCRDALSLDIVIAIDDMDNQVWMAYGSAPNAAYLIGRDGRVIARHGSFHPPTFERSIKRCLSGVTPKKGNMRQLACS